MTVQLFETDIEATFVSRPNRFIILARLADDSVVRAHSANPGRMLELLLPGTTLLLRSSEDPRRKTPFTVVAVRRPSDGRVVPLVSVAANLLARELILPRLFPEAIEVRGEVTRGSSRFDFLVTTPDRRIWVEVKSCTLEAKGVAMFPDAATERGRRHVEELTEIDDDGRMLLFVIQGLSAERFVPDIHTDPAFGLALEKAAEKGVDVRAVSVSCSPVGVAEIEELDVPVDFSPLEAVREESGIYILQLELEEARRVTVGALGTVSFGAGHYLYVGSAMGSLSRRTRRHLTRRKRFHWHVDYLRDVASRAFVYPIQTTKRLECELATDLMALYEAPVERFGSSDCSCTSHLFYSPNNPRQEHAFIQLLLHYRHGRAIQY